jgi:hypothetical protein
MTSEPLSLSSPHSITEERPAAALSDPAPVSGASAASWLFVAVFGLLLASFPARYSELWAHLASGRALVHGALERVSPTWLYDVVVWGLLQTVGGVGLVAVKAGVVAGLAVVLLRLSRIEGGWLLPVACTVLAMLAVGSRAPLTPTTVSYLLLAVAARQAWRSAPDGRVWPGWWSVGLFLLWGNTDRWFLLGLAVVALIRLGRWLDEPVSGLQGFLRVLGTVAVLAAAAAANPAHLSAFPLPEELGWGSGAARQAVTSPFARAYLSSLGVSASTLAYYPLFGLGLVSFLLAAPKWEWGRFLPWAGLALLSAFQARAVPFFAVVAGPVLAWNLWDFFACRPRPSFGPRRRAVISVLVAVLAAAFLVSAWPGWLQRPPFEPRRWGIEPAVGVEQATEAVRRGYDERLWPEGTRTLHLSRETASAFTWLCPEDEGVFDPSLAKVLTATGDPRTAKDEPLWAAGIGRVVVQAADRGSRTALARLLADPDRWPLLHLEGGVVVFGHRHRWPSGPAPEDGLRGLRAAGPPTDDGPDPFRGHELDFDRLAFQPAEGEKAPPAPAAPRRWWEAFWQSAPLPSGDREDAAVLLLKAEVLREDAPRRHLAEWEAVQMTALIAAGAGWVGPAGGADAAVRLTVVHPPVPEAGEKLAPITRFTFACQQPFVLARDDSPPGLLYAAIRRPGGRCRRTRPTRTATCSWVSATAGCCRGRESECGRCSCRSWPSSARPRRARPSTAP